MRADQQDENPREWHSVLIDLSGVPIADLVERDDSALARAARRVTEEATRGEPIAGFNSAL